MNILSIIFALLLVALIGSVVLSRDFRRWLGDTLEAIVLLIANAWPGLAAWIRNLIRFVARVIGVYSLVLGIVALVALSLIIAGLLIGNPTFIAISFVIALSLILTTWMPAGILLRIFRINSCVVPKAMKTFIAWVAFVGFLGLVFPGILSLKHLVGVALVGFIALGAVSRFNAINKYIFPFVLIICLIVVWKHFFPEDFRSSTRFLVSMAKKFNTSKDWASINNETDAATTYAVVLSDISNLYTIENNSIKEVKKNLKRGTIVKFANHKNEVAVLDGQGFVRIILPKANRSFVNGEKYWIEAEFVQIANPRDVIPKDDSLLPKNQKNVTDVISSYPKDSVFTTGTYYIDVKGATPYNIVIAPSRDGCARYGVMSDNDDYEIRFMDGETVRGSSTASLRHREHPKFKLYSENGNRVKVIVM